MFIAKEGMRQRYIGFIIIPSKNKCFSRHEMIKVIRKKCKQLFGEKCNKERIYLTRFNGKKGIVRCKHTEKKDTIELLRSIQNISSHPVKVETVGTSGTIKSLIKKHMDESLR